MKISFYTMLPFHNRFTNKWISVTIAVALSIGLSISATAQKRNSTHPINMLFTSDAHYGIFRKAFRGDTNVAGHTVNAAMIKQMNTLPGTVLPADGGVEAGSKLQGINYLIQTGDITNRMEIPIQSAASSWKEFETDYFNRVTVKPIMVNRHNCF